MLACRGSLAFWSDGSNNNECQPNESGRPMIHTLNYTEVILIVMIITLPLTSSSNMCANGPPIPKK